MKKKLKDKEMTVYDKAVRLVEGGQVEIEGLTVKAVSVNLDEDACYKCDLASICRGKFVEVCRECDSLKRGNYLLQLVSE